MKKILVVDDDVDILELISTMLSMRGYQVDTTPHWEKMEEAISKFKPQLLLLDVSLNGADGRQLCKSLKAKKETAGLPVILFSADPEMGKSITDCGASEFMAKPFELSQLLRLLEAHASENELSSAN